MKRLTTFLLLLLGFSWYGCNSDVPNLSSDEVFAIRSVDIGNNQNASDLIVSFKVNNPSTVKELRAFLINPADFPNFTSTQAEELPRSSFHSITTIEADNQVVLPATLNDVNGAAIEKDVDYFIGFAVLIADDILLNSQIGEAKITDDHFLTGRFSGTWDDNLYAFKIVLLSFFPGAGYSVYCTFSYLSLHYGDIISPQFYKFFLPWLLYYFYTNHITAATLITWVADAYVPIRIFRTVSIDTCTLTFINM